MCNKNPIYFVIRTVEWQKSFLHLKQRIKLNLHIKNVLLKDANQTEFLNIYFNKKKKKMTMP